MKSGHFYGLARDQMLVENKLKREPNPVRDEMLFANLIA